MWDFNFPRGLAPGLLDGFSIGGCERNTESFGLSAASFESGAIFWGKIAPALEPVKKMIPPPLSFY